jgi:hypothetical protein
MMNRPAADFIDADRYTLRVDEATAIVPCVGFVLCLDRMGPTGVQEFHDRGLEALSGAVTPCQDGSIARTGSGFPDDRAQAWLEAFDEGSDA